LFSIYLILVKKFSRQGGIEVTPYLILKNLTESFEFNLNFYVKNVRKEVVRGIKGGKI